MREPSAVVEHEASTSKIGEDQLFYFQQRGVDVEDAVGVIISGFCREVFNELPLEVRVAVVCVGFLCVLVRCMCVCSLLCVKGGVGVIISGFCREAFNKLPLEVRAPSVESAY